MDFSIILFPLELTRNRIYPAQAAQQLTGKSILYNNFSHLVHGNTQSGDSR